MNKKIKTLMKTAEIWANESYCQRMKVGAVLAKDDRILATGYNGTISGLENKCEEELIEYNGKIYKSIWDFVKKYKIKLFNTPEINNDIPFYTMKISLDTNKEKLKVYFFLSKREYDIIKPILYEKSQKEKYENLNRYLGGSLEEYIISELRKWNYIEIKEITSDFTLHAEQNVITFCAKNGIPTDDTELFVTLSPCSNCAKLIAQSGIKKVYYKDEYRDTSGIKFLKEVGVEVEKV